MSHEVQVHEAQTSILRELLFIPAAGYAELQKPTNLTSDHFNFHISRLIELGFVEKTSRGRYQLTVKGKEYANRLDTDNRTVERQGKIAVLILPNRTSPSGVKEYMVQERLKQPFWGYYGFMSGKLRWGEEVLEGAARELQEETGLTATLTLRGLYHKMDYTTDGKLLEDKHFYIIEATETNGPFVHEFEGGRNYWLSRAEILAHPRVHQGIDFVIDTFEVPGIHFIEQAYKHSEREY